MSQTDLHESTVAGKVLTSSLRIDRFADVRFVAKVALGGGYFIYGDAIRTAMDCNELRLLITLDLYKAQKVLAFQNSGVRVVRRFSGEMKTSGDLGMYKLFCESAPHSTLIAIPHHDAISFHVGVVGMYLGSVIVPAKTDNLPIDGPHDVGHVVCISDKQLYRKSLRDFAIPFYKNLVDEDPPSPSSEKP